MWYEKNKVSEGELAKQRNKEFPYMPLFSILVPVYNTPIPYLWEMLDSVRNQTYQNGNCVLRMQIRRMKTLPEF